MVMEQQEEKKKENSARGAVHVFLFIYYHRRHSPFIETVEKRWCHDPHTSTGDVLESKPSPLRKGTLIAINTDPPSVIPSPHSFFFFFFFIPC